MRVTVREEDAGCVDAIRQVVAAAFGQPDEARLVDLLRDGGGLLLSLVAEVGGRVVGHVAFSPVSLPSPAGDLAGAALAPMAVAPAHQRQGIGSQLVTAGLDRLAARACPFVVVLGHPEYYPRFGFVPAARHAIACPWDVPPEVFMVLPLDPARLAGASGLVTYREEFSAVT